MKRSDAIKIIWGGIAMAVAFCIGYLALWVVICR
jgi:heme O synthase-like polyprenyltransferase